MAHSPDDLPEGTDSIIDDNITASETESDVAFQPAIGLGTDDTGGASKREAFKQKFADATAGFKEQAGEKARAYATEGKDKATDALDNLAKLVNDAAGSVDEQLGSQYGDYARKAAEMVSGLSSSLQAKDVDALVADASDLVRKSPVAAIGAAAALGFVLVRLVKSGLEATAPTPDTTPSEAA